AGAMSVRGVFEQAQVVLLRERLKGIHLCGTATEVNDDDGAGAAGDGGFGCLRGEIEALRIDVHKYRRGLTEEDGACRGHKRVWRYDDFVAGANAECAQGHFDRDGSIRTRDGMRNLMIAG